MLGYQSVYTWLLAQQPSWNCVFFFAWLVREALHFHRKLSQHLISSRLFRSESKPLLFNLFIWWSWDLLMICLVHWDIVLKMTFSDSELSKFSEFDLHASGLWDDAKLFCFFYMVCFKNAIPFSSHCSHCFVGEGVKIPIRRTSTTSPCKLPHLVRCSVL